MGLLDDAEVDEVKSDDVKELIVLYKAMVDEVRSCETLSAKGKKVDRTRYQRLEIKVNALWIKLSNNEQLSAVRDLVASKHMDERVAEVLVIFGGRIDMRKPAEPCIKL